MPDKIIKPNPEDILDLHDKCKQIYSELHSQFDRADTLYELNFKDELQLPDEYANRGVVLPTARDFLDACVDHTNVYNARVFVNRKGESKLSLERQNLLRKISLGILYRTNVEATISPWRVGSKYFWLYGQAPMETVWDADLYPKYPEQKKGESDEAYASKMDEWRANFGGNMPLAIKALHPKTIMQDPFDEGGKFIFKTRKILVYHAREKFGWPNPSRRVATDEVEWITYMDRKWRCEFFDREVVAGGVRAHNYGMLPYVFINTGLGNVDANNKPEKKVVGILNYVEDLLISESRNYSIADVVLALESWPWFTIEGKDMGSVSEIHRNFGEVTKIGDNKLVAQQPALPPEALNRHLDRTAGYLSSHISPNAARGQGEEGVRSASHFNQIMAQVSTRYQYSTEAFKHGAAKVLSNSLRVLKNVVPGDFNVWARGQTPADQFDIEFTKDDLVEPFNCVIEFAPVSEEEEYRRHDDQERLVQSGIASRHWARTQNSNMDPEQMEIDAYIEQINADPAVMQVRSQYAAAKQLAALMQRQAAEGLVGDMPMAPLPPEMGGQPSPMMGGGEQQAGRRMGPVTPNMPTSGSGADLQNQMKRNRSQTPMNPTQGRGGGGNRP